MQISINYRASCHSFSHAAATPSARRWCLEGNYSEIWLATYFRNSSAVIYDSRPAVLLDFACLVPRDYIRLINIMENARDDTRPQLNYFNPLQRRARGENVTRADEFRADELAFAAERQDKRLLPRWNIFRVRPLSAWLPGLWLIRQLRSCWNFNFPNHDAGSVNSRYGTRRRLLIQLDVKQKFRQ